MSITIANTGKSIIIHSKNILFSSSRIILTLYFCVCIIVLIFTPKSEHEPQKEQKFEFSMTLFQFLHLWQNACKAMLSFSIFDEPDKFKHKNILVSIIAHWFFSWYSLTGYNIFLLSF